MAAPVSSATLIEIRLASGAEPAYWPYCGSLDARSAPLPATRPATAVPWPYVSVAVVALGSITAEAITREVVSLCEVWKSGRSPAMPVSITATPTPAPVLWRHKRVARIEAS